MSNKTTELKRGVYQLRAGKEVWVARNERSLKRKMRLFVVKPPTDQKGIDAIIPPLLQDGFSFKVYTTKNQKGRKVEVTCEKESKHICAGYKLKTGKRNEKSLMIRPKIKCLKKSS